MRRELEGRPLLPLFLAFLGGLALPAQPWVGLLLLALLAALQTLSRRLLVASGVLAGVLLAPSPVSPLRENRFVEGSFTVAGSPKERSYGTTTIVEGAGARYAARFPSGTLLARGEVVRLKGVAEPIGEGQDDWASSQRLVGRLNVEPDLWVRENPAPWPFQRAAEVRARFLALTERTLDPEAAAMVDALCFNADGYLQDEQRDALQRTGTVHIISASGLHVLLLAAMLQFVFGVLPMPRVLVLALVAGSLVFFAMAAGLNPPVVRAVLMGIAGSFAYTFRREADGLSALSAVGIGILLWRPEASFEAGFHLSFLIVGALALYLGGSAFEPGLGSHARATVGQAVATSAVASLAASPLVAHQFGFVSLVSIPANLLVGVVVGPIIGVSTVALLVDPWAPSLATGLLTWGVRPLVGYLETVVNLLAKPSWAALTVESFSPLWLIPLYAAGLLVWRKRLRAA